MLESDDAIPTATAAMSSMNYSHSLSRRTRLLKGDGDGVYRPSSVDGVHHLMATMRMAPWMCMTMLYLMGILLRVMVAVMQELSLVKFPSGYQILLLMNLLKR